jgi:CRISPR/Cas system-associated exonuclease Cas4 (RecB family)
MQNLNFTGTQINYYFVCHRKLWLFSKDIRFEDENEYVQLGKIPTSGIKSRLRSAKLKLISLITRA